MRVAPLAVERVALRVLDRTGLQLERVQPGRQAVGGVGYQELEAGVVGRVGEGRQAQGEGAAIDGQQGLGGRPVLLAEDQVAAEVDRDVRHRVLRHDRVHLLVAVVHRTPGPCLRLLVGQAELDLRDHRRRVQHQREVDDRIVDAVGRDGFRAREGRRADAVDVHADDVVARGHADEDVFTLGVGEREVLGGRVPGAVLVRVDVDHGAARGR